jgi:DNA (cytosine-5)-methyltransferase 1
MPGRGGEEAYGDNLIAETLALRGRDGGATAELGGEQATALRASQGGGDKPHVLISAIPIQDRLELERRQNGLGIGAAGDPMFTLDAASRHGIGVYPTLGVRDAKGPSSNADQAPPLVMPAGVRRLTPRECERLQGFPDDWTRWTADGREIADSHRYRMMGNAVTVPVAEWLGHRLVAVDRMLRCGL